MYDAVLISILAYAGLRRSAALALAWTHVRERAIRAALLPISGPA